MDKKIFLLNKNSYRKELVENLTEKDLDEWVADELRQNILTKAEH